MRQSLFLCELLRLRSALSAAEEGCCHQHTDCFLGTRKTSVSDNGIMITL